MNQGTSVFSQILSFIDYDRFRSFVARYDGDRGARRLSCWEQFLAMAFAQLTRRESLRDIEVSLADTGDVVLTQTGMVLEGNMVYQLVIMGSVGDENHPLEVRSISDTTKSEDATPTP